MKKVVFLCRNFNIGGPQKSLLALLDHFDYTKAEVYLYYIHGGGVLHPYINENVRQLQFDPLLQYMLIEKGQIARSFLYFLKKGHIGLLFYAAYLMFWKIVTRKSMNVLRQRLIRKYARLLKFDDIEFDFGAGVSDCIMTYLLVDRVKAKVKYHWIRSDYRIMDLDHTIEEEYFRKIDGAFAVSAECGDIFCSVYPFMKGKVHEFINYIPTQYYEKIESDAACVTSYDGYKIVSVCRIDPLKGLEIAIGACRLLLDKYKLTGFKWFVLGDGPVRGKVEEIIEKEGLKEYFVLLGMKKNVFSILKECDLFVHPSRTEGRSNSVEAAKICCLPVILPRYDTAHNQIEDQVDGCICDLSEEALAEAIDDLMHNGEKVCFFKENLKKRTAHEYNSLKLVYDLLDRA